MFTGFTEEMIAFFAALGVNNNREFFEENREAYQRAVREPLLALAEALAPVVREVDPEMDVRPGRAVSRIYRDVRFSRNKSPYRDHMWIGYHRLGETPEDACGFYFDVSATAAHFGCGYYLAKPAYMQKLRERITLSPGHVLSILTAPAFADTFTLMGESYARQHQPPADMPPPLRALYGKKNVYAEHSLSTMEELFSPNLAEVVANGFRALAPFHGLLRSCMIRRDEEARV